MSGATRVALLRAVNLAVHEKLRMAALRDFFAALGYADAQTLLATGNVVFTAREKPAALEAKFERESPRRLKLATEYFVRTAEELDAVIAANPLGDMAREDPSHLVLLFLKRTVVPAQVKALNAAIKGREVVRAMGRHAYIAYPDGIGTSKLTSAVIERHLGTRGTGRNWNTVRKLATLAGSVGRSV